jgi:hypothetical protein
MLAQWHDKCSNERDDEYCQNRDFHRDLDPVIKCHESGLLELLGPEQGVGEVDEKPNRHEAGEPIIEHHGVASLETVAGDGVANRQRKKAKAKRKQDQVQHSDAPCQTDVRICSYSAFAKRH